MSKSHDFFNIAKKIIPGGVNSPVRACLSVNMEPLFIRSSNGSRLVTVDGQELIDFVMSWGPMLLGHNNQNVANAIMNALSNGVSYGAPCEGEILLAKEIITAMPSIEMVRMVNSGTEATMSAMRLARGFTKRDKIVKFEGGYHGHSDAFLASAGSGVATQSIPGTPGVPCAVVADTLLAPYNDLLALEQLFEIHGKDIAAVFVEPVAGNMGLVPPNVGYLENLRKITAHYGSLLIFDEVITGFRVDFGGAQKVFGIEPDLTCLGKIIGGGLPVGAYGGRKEIMENIAPLGDIYQAGTLSGNPLAMAAGLATLKELKTKNYELLAQKTFEFSNMMLNILKSKDLPVQCNQISSLFTLFFTTNKVTNFDTAKQVDTVLYSKFYQHMRAQNIYLAPSAFECIFTSFAHTPEDFEQTIEAIKQFNPN